jgi:hypothetical protein
MSSIPCLPSVRYRITVGAMLAWFAQRWVLSTDFERRVREQEQ